MKEAERFRAVMSQFATGVTVVTGSDPDGRTVGLTANAFTSVSLQPRIVLVCVSDQSVSRDAILATERFGVSVLRRGDEALAQRFAGDTRAESFDGLTFRRERTGCPIVTPSLGWLDCTLWRTVEAGDHTVLFGQVEACGVGQDAEPLVFFRGRYRKLQP